MDYTSIHIYGHLLSDDILHSIERDNSMQGNRDQDFSTGTTATAAIDYVWSSVLAAYKYYKERSTLNDPYGTRRSRDLMERLLADLGWHLQRQTQFTTTASGQLDITYMDADSQMPVIVVGAGDGGADAATGGCSLDTRTKGTGRRRSPHATMLDYLASTEAIYGIVANGNTIRLLRNTGQLVKLTYIEFDLRRMVEEDKYTEFCLMFRLMHASRFRAVGDEPMVMERWFNLSVESGNRIRSGLSAAVAEAMRIIGTAAVRSQGEEGERLRKDINEGRFTAAALGRELIHFIYRLLFLFIIEDRGLVYQLPKPDDHDYERQSRLRDIYYRHYAASRLRRLSELPYLRQRQYSDLWQSLLDTFRLFETGGTGAVMGIAPLGGRLFASDTLSHLSRTIISNADLLEAFAKLNEFPDERGQRVKINYSSLDVEEFGSVYEGILEMRPVITPAVATAGWTFGYDSGLDRQSTASYYTRPDLVQSLIHTALEPVIKQRIATCNTTDEKVQSLLSLRVCDPASGSGHIVLAMARTIAWYVCSLRTGEDNPASSDYRQALREVIQRCVYAVDCNPDAVELCKVVLWIEGYNAGKPLSFLDHHIRCGNSVVGVADLNKLLDGVPNEAFNAEDKETMRAIVSLNRRALQDVELIKEAHGEGISMRLFDGEHIMTNITDEQVSLADEVRTITTLPENSLLEQLTKQRRWEDLMQSPRVECLRRACDIYTDAFFYRFTADDIAEEEMLDDEGKLQGWAHKPIPYTRTVYHALEEISHLGEEDSIFKPLDEEYKRSVCREAHRHRFFHWAVEFPDVFAQGGRFNCMCGNPPWDKLQMEDEKWFAGKNNDIVAAPNQAIRDRLINALQQIDPALFNMYIEARHEVVSQAAFIKYGKRFPLTATGKLELSSLFAELCLGFSAEAWGLVLPTAIAVNDSNKTFFTRLIEENRLLSLYSFENEEKIFQIHHSFKFCLLTAGKAQTQPREVRGGFYLRRLDHLLDPRRIYTLRTDDFARLNPNTKTCPVFRTSRDAQLTARIYRRATILLREKTEHTPEENPWGVRFASIFNMSTDSHLFRTRQQLVEAGAQPAAGARWTLDSETYVPLYEGKMIWHYHHHYGAFPTDIAGRPNSISTPLLAELQDPASTVAPWYWVPQSSVDDHLIKTDTEGNVLWQWTHKWMLAYRDITNATTERTFICALIPDAVGVGHTATLLFAERGCMPAAILAAMMTSLVFDYTARNKGGGNHMSTFIVKQLPVLRPNDIPAPVQREIVRRLAELTYWNHDMDGWAKELWAELPEEWRADLSQLGHQEPWTFDPAHRAVLQAELDAIFAHLYGLSTEDLRYILLPEDVCGEGCINETFRVLRDNETRLYGEYRTRRLMLEAWQRFGYDN